MSFWQTQDGKAIEATGTFDMGGGSVIPDNTNCKACIEEIEWSEWEGDRYINARWTVLAGPYKGRKVFQKIKVEDSDISRRDKAVRMLAAIDANAGGHLMKSGKEPTDNMLQKALCNKPMIIKVMVWEMNGKSGNWVSLVAALDGDVKVTEEEEQEAPAADDEDIPW